LEEKKGKKKRRRRQKKKCENSQIFSLPSYLRRMRSAAVAKVKERKGGTFREKKERTEKERIIISFAP